MKKTIKIMCVLAIIAILAVMIFANITSATSVTVTGESEVSLSEGSVAVTFSIDEDVNYWLVEIAYSADLFESIEKDDIKNISGTVTDYTVTDQGQGNAIFQFENVNSTTETINGFTIDIGLKAAGEGEISVKNVQATINGTNTEAEVPGTYYITITSNDTEELTIAPSSSTDNLAVGDIINFTTSKEVTIWSSSDTSVATVSDGTVTIIGYGSATITAIDSAGNEATYSITVNEPASSTFVSISEDEITISVGGTQQLNCDVTENVGLSWSSGDTSIATVDNGVVTGIAEGTTTISATANDGSGANDTVTVNVVGQTSETGVILSVSELNLSVGATYTITEVNGKSVTWSTSSDSIAIVDGNGTVTGVGEGTATITATDSSGNSASVTVNVTSSGSGTGTETTTPLTLSTYSLELEKGETQIVTVTSGDTVTWEVNDSTVAIVNNGNITGVGAGGTIVTATSTSTGNKAYINVTVNDSSSGQTSTSASAPVLSKSSVTLAVNETVTITADKSVTWKSDNESVAIVDSNGTITGRSEGTAVITATSTSDSTFTTVLVTVTATSSESGTNVTGTSNSTTTTTSTNGTVATTANSTSTANSTISQTGESEAETLAVLIIATLIVSAIIFRKKSKIK